MIQEVCHGGGDSAVSFDWLDEREGVASDLRYKWSVWVPALDDRALR